jgi:DNA repair exonuclease SbcCD nuclease subunit
MIRFLHTADWQLGMVRHFFSEGVQEKFTQARFDAIRTLGHIAKAHDCHFMVVCGDVFESNQVDRKTVNRALEALKESSIPVFLLPGNHDPLNAGSVYRSTTFLERKPAHVHVIQDTTPISLGEHLQIIGAPWTSKRPVRDLVAEALAPLEAAPDVKRVCVAHGAIDVLSPNSDDPALISLVNAERALTEGKIHYLALGDRHSLTEVGQSGCVLYAGTPESTDYDEQKPGFALVVEIDTNDVRTKEVHVGNWHFIERERVDLNTIEDLEALHTWLNGVQDKERTILKVRLTGTLTLLLHGQLYGLLDDFRELLGAIEIRADELIVVPEDSDFADLGFSGFTSGTVERLRSMVAEPGSDSITARDSLALLVRLARATE